MGFAQTVVGSPAASVAVVCSLCVTPFSLTVLTAQGSAQRAVTRSTRPPDAIPYGSSAFFTSC